VQDALHDKDDGLLMSVTGLEGGCVANGSTCGIASGGALGIALMNDDLLKNSRNGAETAVLNTAGEYMEWFDKTFSTTQCRERNKVDFHSVMGQLKYFLSARKIIRCMLMAGGAINHLTLNKSHQLTDADVNTHGNSSTPSIHCAQEVLKQVREKTGVGNDRLERISIVFDGGIGLKGRLCGAVAGSILALNLIHGFNLRQMGYQTNIKKFVIGHMNLMRKSPGKYPVKLTDTFSIGKEMVNQFKEEAGSIECRHITGREFNSPEDFKRYMETSERCKNLIRVSADIASKAITDNNGLAERSMQKLF
jgi:C_GCAxxG_C_C family probable redox protein